MMMTPDQYPTRRRRQAVARHDGGRPGAALKAQRGHSLVELLIVMVIIVIVAGLAFTRFSGRDDGVRLEELCDVPRGLILVTGPTGSGKSTTLAAMIDKINRERRKHILTIEDPIEFIHRHKNCLVNQREVGTNTHGFADALRVGLRQDPDVVLVGELRDLETIEAALRIAETGHLTFATLHTNSAASTITRIVDVFPAMQQPQVRTQLSQVLEGVLSQQLLPRASGEGRVMALEIMLPNPAVRHLIRTDKIHSIYSVMVTGQEEHGMRTLNQSLAELFMSGEIGLPAALRCSSDTKELKELIESRSAHGARLSSTRGAS